MAEPKKSVSFFANAAEQMGSKKVGVTVAVILLLMHDVDYGELAWLKGICVAFVGGMYLISQGIGEHGSGRHTVTPRKPAEKPTATPVAPKPEVITETT